MPASALLVVAAMLIAGTVKLPYGYYTLLRLVVCASAGYEAYTGLITNKKSIVPWIAIGIALLFNPFIPVHLHKADWAPIDIAVGLSYAVLAVVRFRSERQSASKG